MQAVITQYANLWLAKKTHLYLPMFTSLKLLLITRFTQIGHKKANPIFSGYCVNLSLSIQQNFSNKSQGEKKVVSSNSASS